MPITGDKEEDSAPGSDDPVASESYYHVVRIGRNSPPCTQKDRFLPRSPCQPSPAQLEPAREGPVVRVTEDKNLKYESSFHLPAVLCRRGRLTPRVGGLPEMIFIVPSSHFLLLLSTHITFSGPIILALGFPLVL